MYQALDFITYLAKWTALVVICIIVFGCGDDITNVTYAQQENNTQIFIRYYGYEGYDTDPQKESPTASLYDDTGNLLHILYNSEEYDSIMVPACSLTVRYIDNWKYREPKLWPEAGNKYTVRHPVVEVIE